ncbi:MAG: HYR domain-containing protein, partial [Chitinophagaceae bacterium]
SQNPGTVFPVGTTTVTATATDASKNTATCTFTVTVVDNEKPVITCPAPVTQNNDAGVCGAKVTYTAPVGTDNCTGATTKQTAGLASGSVFPVGTTTNTFTVTDAAGNSTACSFTVTVKDAEAPAITCPAPVTVQCAGDVPAPNTALVTASDNCGGTVTKTWVSDVISNQSCANRYTITRTYRAADAGGNSSTCTQTITVNDNTAPVITCPAPLTVQCSADVPAPNAAGLTATDNCGGTVTTTFVSDVITNQICANRYTITRTYRATDVCGNTSTCTQTITVNDNTAPVITCPAPLTVQCSGDVPAPNAAGLTATDNCGGTVTKTFVSDVITNQTCANRYTITRTYRATDVCGNSSTCTQTITVNDNTAPVITCPAPLTVQCASAVPAPNAAGLTATDNCGGTVTRTFVSDVITNQTCANRYTITRTYRATDVCGNSSTCTQTITVNDNTAPVITCPANVTVSCGASTLPAATGAATATDNCGGTVTITYSDVTTSCSDGTYIISRTWRATDVCNNSSSCTQTITVNKIKTAGCFSSNITTLSYNGTNTTFTFRVCANGCSAALSHVSFIIGSGIRVVAPLNGSTYQGTHNKYTVSVPVSKDVNGIKYDVIGEGIKNNGECDVFSFTLAGDQRNTSITVQFKAGTTTTQAIFNPTQCFCQSSKVTTRTTSDTSTTSPATSNTTIAPVVNDPMLRDRKISSNPESFKVTAAPNPSTTDFKIKVESISNELINIRIIDAMGRVMATITGVQKGSLVTLGGNYRGGSYFAEVVQGANHKTVKLIKLN